MTYEQRPREANPKKRIVVLGATGSIGTQALSLLKEDPSYELVGVTARSSAEKLLEIARSFPSLRALGIASSNEEKLLKEARLESTILSGQEANMKIVDLVEPDVVLNAITGFQGFLPSLHALKKDKVLLLANKETLVVGGRFVDEVLSSGKGRLYPIDSEHAALAMCLADVPEGKRVKKLFITASGGALRDYPLERIAWAPVEDVLKHPTWSMGPKITVDSATMVNKAYEVLEASLLFHRPVEDVQAFVDRSSFCHAALLLEGEENPSIYACFPNTMLIPIRYALSLGKDRPRTLTASQVEALGGGKALSGEAIAKDRYPMFFFLSDLFERFPRRAPIAANAVDEVVVDAYLNGRIRFGDLETILRKVSSRLARTSSDPSSLSDVLALDESARKEAERMVSLFANALASGQSPSAVVATPLRQAKKKRAEEALDEEARKRRKKASRWKNDPSKKSLLKARERERKKKGETGSPERWKKEGRREKEIPSFGDYMEKREGDSKGGRRPSRGSRPSEKSGGKRSVQGGSNQTGREGHPLLKRRAFHRRDDKKRFIGKEEDRSGGKPSFRTGENRSQKPPRKKEGEERKHPPFRGIPARGERRSFRRAPSKGFAEGRSSPRDGARRSRRFEKGRHRGGQPS